MKLPGALLLLGAVLLLISGGVSVICPAIKQEIELLLGPSLPEYVNFVKKYKNDNATLENAENLKKCVDSNLTKVDKENVLSLP
ncbi:major allergen I polypeptide chain 1-like, partial [Cricetulus griseus]|uniref:Major allergen I polypeptide chain 1-like n=1 Tax=Cricetulus griseus TaxID=10029 RepID=A0A9J7GLM3_CRIGR